MGWGGGVGVLVGLAAPPLLASIAVGAAAGGIVGKFAKHKVDSGLEQGLGEKLKPGTAAIIAIIDEEHRLEAERALAGSPAKSVAPMDKHGLRGLKDALAEAAGKFVPDRTVLPIPDKTFGGTAGRTLEDSVADWSFIPGPKAPEDAPNVLLVLIDDAGFGSIDSFGGPVTHAGVHARAGHGHHVQPLPRDGRVLADARGAAHRPQPAPRRLRLRRRVPRALPRLLGQQAAVLRRLPAHPQGERLRHRRLRQVAPHAGQRAGRGGSVRPLAQVLGLRPLVGLPQRRGRPVRPHHHAGRLDAGRPRGQGRRALLLPRRHHRQGGRVAARGARPGHAEAVDALLLHRLRPCPAPRRQGVGGQVQGPVRRRLGRAARAHPGAAEGARHRAAGHRAHRAPRRLPRLGLAHRRRRRSSTCARWRSTAASRRTPTGTSAACSTPSRRWATSTTRSSSTSGATTAPAWRARPPARSTR